MPSHPAKHDDRDTPPSAPERSRRAKRTRSPASGRGRRSTGRSPGQASRQSAGREYGHLDAHPAILKIGLGASLWFLAAMWLAFSWTTEGGFAIAVATVFLIVSFTTVLLCTSYTQGDPRWHRRYVTLSRFLEGRVSIATGPVRGREVFIQILLIPVSLALAMTMIGIVWIAVS